MLTQEAIEAILARGYESPNAELKGPGSASDRVFFAKVTRAALAMGNLRDGGYVIVGIDDHQMGEMQPGLNEEQAQSWHYDDVARRLREYSDPPLAIDLGTFPLSSGATVVVLEVAEFVETPHFCARDAGETLRRGVLYVRASTVPETRAIASAEEMRELITLSTEKRLRRIIQTTGRAGAQIVASDHDPNQDNFEAQRRLAFK